MFTFPDVPRRSDTRRRILDAARSILAERGAEGCSMRAVAERSHITAGAIYRHFRNKRALVDRVVEGAFDRFERSLLDAIVSLPVGSFARIAALGEAYIQFAEEHEEEFKVLFMPTGGGRRRLEDLPGQVGYPILRRCVAEAIEGGALKPADPDHIALYLWSRVHGIVMLLLACDLGEGFGPRGGLEPVELFELTRDFVTEGLLPDG